MLAIEMKNYDLNAAREGARMGTMGDVDPTSVVAAITKRVAIMVIPS